MVWRVRMADKQLVLASWLLATSRANHRLKLLARSTCGSLLRVAGWAILGDRTLVGEANIIGRSRSLPIPGGGGAFNAALCSNFAGPRFSVPVH
jgi:hypothetical protein